jgi:hypothetical protein
VKTSSSDTPEGQQKTFYINYLTKELILPKPTKDTEMAYALTVALTGYLWPKKDAKIYTEDDPESIGLSSDQVSQIVKNLVMGFDIAKAGRKKLSLSDSLIAKLYFDYALQRYRSRFINLKRNEKLPTMDQFMTRMRLNPIMKGKEGTIMHNYLKLWFGILARLLDFEWKNGKFTSHLCQSFFEAYKESDIPKETLKEALKEDRVKIIDVNSFNNVLFENESNFVDSLEIETPGNFSKFFAVIQLEYNKGNYTVLEEVHRYNRSIREKIGPIGLEILFRRLKARNKYITSREIDVISKREKLEKGKLDISFFLPMMKDEEIRYYRPLGFILGAARLCSRWEDTAATRSLWKVTSKSLLQSREAIIDVHLKHDESQRFIGNQLNKFFPEDCSDQKNIDPEMLLKRASERASLMSLIMAAFQDADNAIRKLIDSSGNQLSRINI